MTRDEAIETWYKWVSNEHPVDALVALGMLKLDEPEDKSLVPLSRPHGVAELGK